MCIRPRCCFSGAIGLLGDRFGGGQQIQLPAFSSVSCTGNEDRFGDCTFNSSSFDSRCEIASVVCQGVYDRSLCAFNCSLLFTDPISTPEDDCSTNDVRLVSGDRTDLLDGRVEVCINRAWGTVCSEGFNDEDARVVCRSFNGSGECAIRAGSNL